jgi:macrolide transport system ATP-binding/permease protein
MGGSVETFIQDLRYGIRTLLKRPAFTAVAVLSLALGIGANTTIFSLLYSVLLRPLAVEEPDRIAALTNDVISYPAYKDFRDQNEVFTGLAAFAPRSLSMGREGKPELVSADVVSGNYFDVVGVKPALGRTFLAAEDQTPGGPAVAVLSHTLWQRSFGSDRNITGKTLALNGQSFEIIGVAPREFRGATLTYAPDLWVPIQTWPRLATGSYARLNLDMRGWGWLRIVGRLKPGVSIEQAQSALNVLAARQEQEYAKGTPKDFSVELSPVTTAATGIRSRGDFLRFLGLLAAIVGIALAIACSNVANLLLVKATGRRKEIAVRLALGAGRGRIVRQMLTESVLLALIGGAVGLLVAVWAIDLIKAYQLPGGIPLDQVGIALNVQALGFTLLVSLVTGIVFGLAPALQASKPDLVAALKDQVSQTASRSFLRNSLVTAQVALCLLLLVGAGLFIRSLRNALAIDPGFDPHNVALASVNLGLQRYTKAQAASFYEQLSERVEALPGVESASWAINVPVSADVDRESFSVSGYQPQPGERMSVDTNMVGVNYFRTMGIPIVAGREFGHGDREATGPVVVISEAMARRYWQDRDPVGQSVKVFNIEAKVIGVAKDSKYHSLRESPLPYIYVPLGQAGSLSNITFIARTSGNVSSLLASVEREAGALDGNVPLFNTETLDQHIGNLLMAERFAATLLGMFSLLALTLAVTGIYGVVAYSVGQRTREIGIRMALGAEGKDILRLVMRRGIVPVLIGVALGLSAAFVVTRVLTSFLYGLSATDLVTFTGAPLALMAVALLACALPARRAMKVDPMVALRYE